MRRLFPPVWLFFPLCLTAKDFFRFYIGINISVIMAYTCGQQKQTVGLISYGALGWRVGVGIALLGLLSSRRINSAQATKENVIVSEQVRVFSGQVKFP
jgi:hypothetical protein